MQGPGRRSWQSRHTLFNLRSSKTGEAVAAPADVVACNACGPCKEALAAILEHIQLISLLNIKWLMIYYHAQWSVLGAIPE